MAFVKNKPPELPWRYLCAKDLKKFRNLLFSARLIVEGAYSGRHRSPYKGAAQEFVDYREYHPGDEIRSIDWRAYARTDRYFVKLFEKDCDLNCYILMDRSASMGFGGEDYKRVLPDAGVSKIEYASYLAAALGYLMVKQGDKVGLSTFDRKVTDHLATGGTFGHLYKMLNILEKQRVGRDTDVSKVLREIAPLLGRRGLLVVISDFIDDSDEVFRALDLYRHRRFEVVLFHVFHQYERELPPLASVNFIDSESGERITSRPADIERGYEKQISEFIDGMAAHARARNIDYNCVTTDTPYSETLYKYLLRRSRL